MVHVHLGDAKFNKETVVFIYYISKIIEKEIFSMLPLSRRKNEYCRELPDINIDLDCLNKDYRYYIEAYYQSIIKLLSKQDYNNKNINKKKDHPAGHKCGYDHHSLRYCWLNLVPTVFDTRKNGVYTVEFRPMSASLSYNKIKNWLLICMGILSVVENNKINILKGEVKNIQDLIRLAYPKDNEAIIDYINSRMDKFNDKKAEQSHINEATEYVEKEIQEDLSFKTL